MMKKFTTYFFCIVMLLSAACNEAGAQHKSLLRPVYAKVACSILKDTESAEIAGLARKGDALLVLRPSFIFITDTTIVDTYKVRCEDGTIGYVYAKYVSTDKAEAEARYMPEYYDPLISKAKNTFGGGDPMGCDIYPRKKEQFKDNVMPEACYSLYLTCNNSVLENIDEYIALAKRTKINTFVIDIKEDGFPGFKADAMKKYAPSAYARARDNEQLYKEVVRKCHENGIWAVGRIVVFKDYHFTKDNPDCALWNKATGEMLYHNKSHWPSAYSRKVWEYNVALAKEAVQKFGFNEINFDYVRFPDRIMKIESGIEMRNKYGESKLQAIQRFVTYAVDEIHKLHAYVSIDVFGEAANPGYTTAYGQYWPAISNVADVISGMPYPDHFSNGYYGIQKPWNHPYEIMRAWGARAMGRQAETPSPAIVRTWVQAYHVLRFVDRNGIDYDAANIEKEIRGLYDAGLTGGYVTWLSSSNIERYRSQAAAFNIDYYRIWLSKQTVDK